jgi:hypothetical protein
MRNRIRHTFAGVLIAFAIISCASDGLLSPDVVPAGANDVEWADIRRSCRPTSPIRDLDASQRRIANAFIEGYGRTVDDEWAEVSSKVAGGFGGYFLQGARYQVYLQDTTDRAAKLRSLAAQAQLSALTESNTDLLPGRWNYGQLFRWYRYLQSEVGLGEGTWATDLDEALNRVNMIVIDTDARALLEARLKALDLPCYLVAIEVRTPPSPFD